MDRQCRPVIKYPGAKWRIADWIISLMPEHKSYLEPFLGSGAVFFRKQPSRIETINDIDDSVINLFSCIRDNPDKLARMVASTPYARKEYEDSFENSSDDPFERARAFLIQCWQGHGFRTYCRSGWKNDVDGREYAYAVRYWNELPEWIVQVVFRLKNTQIECRPAIDVIRRFNRPNVLIYADPPYLLSTRKMKKQYANEMNLDDHIALLNVLKGHSGPVMLSGYDNELYNSSLAGWSRYQTATIAEKGFSRTETLWVNHAAEIQQMTIFD